MSTKFEDLDICTITMVIYSNVDFNLEKIFHNLPLYKVKNVPLTKKKKNPNMKKITAPDNAIVSLRFKNDFRGIVTNPEIIRRVEVKRKINQGEFLTEMDKEIIRDIDKRKYLSDEEKYENGLKTLMKTIDHFLNQVTCIFSVDGKLVNIMLFKDKLKIVGCKKLSHGKKIMRKLWEYIENIEDGWSCNCKLDIVPVFLFESAMTNVGFSLGFKIDRIRLNKIMNRNIGKISSSHYEPTSNSNVNVEFFSTVPPVMKYECYSPFSGDYFTLNENILKTKLKKSYVTFLIFASSKVIMSGKYYETMSDQYDELIKIINENREYIEDLT